ncbi:MAG: type III-B CRISPR module RAMP protein Cmr4 [Methylococcales bacterium]
MSSTTPNPEYNYEAALFGIRAITNLHVGSGSENYGIIDNLIQRDPATNFPCIYSSSLKGALREYCKNYLEGDTQAMIDHIFGKDKKGTEDMKDTEDKDKNTPAPDENFVAGKYRFLQADLLSIPLRGMEKPFYNASCPWLLKNLLHQIGLFRKKLTNDGLSELSVALDTYKGIHFETGSVEVDLDGLKLEPVTEGTNPLEAKKILGDHIAVLNETNFVELVSDYKLPVIARNTLNDGRSANLWYEQVLPRETRLAFFVLYPKEDACFAQFKESILVNPVQIGANASIGYGFCELFEISLT